jgi:RNA polymerase sigma-32 factor
MEAAYRLITSNLRLVVKIALSFQRHWTRNLMDLIQEGNIGLMQAVKKFDPTRGSKFSYYASFWIRAYIIKFIMDNWKLIKIGTTQAQRKLFFNLKKEKERLVCLGVEPEPKLLAQNLGVKEAEVIEMDKRLGTWDWSLDAPIKNDPATGYQSMLPTGQIAVDDQLAEFEKEKFMKEKLATFRSLLSERERFVYDRRLLAEKPLILQEIGARYGVSRERIRQIEVRIIEKLRAYLQTEMEQLEKPYPSPVR